MSRTHLTLAHQQLLHCPPGERFASLQALTDFIRERGCPSPDPGPLPQPSSPLTPQNQTTEQPKTDDPGLLDTWSFGSLCHRIAWSTKKSTNGLSPATANHPLGRNIPFDTRDTLFPTRSSNTGSFLDIPMGLLSIIYEVATDFSLPPRGYNGTTGLYGGRQGLFAFLIDPAGWAEVGGRTVAPGFFLWYSLLGRPSLGIQTFWFKQIHPDHLVWETIEVVNFSCKHTRSSLKGLAHIRRILAALIQQRNRRRHAFPRVLRNALMARLGNRAEPLCSILLQKGILEGLGQWGIERARNAVNASPSSPWSKPWPACTNHRTTRLAKPLASFHSPSRSHLCPKSP